MRRLSIAILCGVVVQLVVPTPAQAWWERIEEWSGPGPFKGPTIDARLACFSTDIDPGKDTLVGTDDDVDTGNGRAQFGGLIFSACRLGEKQKRRAWIDLTMGFLKAPRTPRFGKNMEIKLTTLEPSFSWRVIDNNSWDFFDYGVGAGIYWVTSEAFPAVRGTFLEPVRLDFHAPTSLVKGEAWWLRIPVFRVSLLVFPAGHETAAFAASSDVQPRISRDKVWSYGIYADLDPLLDKIRKITR